MEIELIILPLSLFLLALIFEGVPSFIFIKGLKKYPIVRAHFGNPSLLSESSLVDAFPTNMKLLKRTYTSVSDPSGWEFCDRLRPYMLLGYFFGWILAIAAVILFFIKL